MTKHYALVRVTGISETCFQEYLFDFINKMDAENDRKFGATVIGIDERDGKRIESELSN